MQGDGVALRVRGHPVPPIRDLAGLTATSLRPILAGLADADRATFLDRYRERLARTYPPRPDGTTLYPFLRLFFVAVRG